MKELKRTDDCGGLRKEDIGREVVLMGWLQNHRDHGRVVFLDLRDRSGIVQVVFNQKITELHPEYVLAIKGEVTRRPKGTENPDLSTGEIEVKANDIKILSKAKSPPFDIFEETGVSEEIRLKYRYLDLRRPPMQKNILFRHKSSLLIRNFLDKKDFLEIETPMLTKSTPEGARDYLVPSRVNKGKFYALPQSPQLFKQLLMVAGMEKYFQIVKCFRDEDLRRDRQPEHTQIDIEISFIEEEEIYKLIEEMMVQLFEDLLNVKLEVPFLRLTYEESIERFGTDKPDLRFGMEIIDITEITKKSNFKIFREVITKNGCVKGLNISEGAKFSRQEIENLSVLATKYGAKGLSWMKVKKERIDSPIAKFFKEEELKVIYKAMSSKYNDLMIFIADKLDVTTEVLGQLRLHIARKLNLIKKEEYKFVWVTDFPLLKYDEEEKRFKAMHHPFCMPKEKDLSLFKKDPAKVKARTYDLILNGEELGTGSIRINQRKIQEEVFKCLGISKEKVKEKFGFLLKAFQYGVPPHGGIAIGLDRLLMIMRGADSIREVIAFPKTQKAVSLLTNAPSEVEEEQLKELHIKLTNSAISCKL